MKTLFRLSRLILPLFPVMSLAVIFGTLGFFSAISIPVLGIESLTRSFPLKFLVLAGVLRGVLHYAEQYCNHFIAFTLLARIRNIVFEKLRSLGPARLDGKQKGSLISLLTSDIELLELFYAHTVSPVCIALFVSAGVVAFLLRFHWILAAAAFISFVLVGIFIPAFAQHFSVKAGKEKREKFSQMNSFLLDCLRGLSQTILFGTGEKRLSMIKTKSEELSKVQKKMSINEGRTSALIEGSVFFCDILMLFTAIFLYQKEIIDFNAAVISVAALFSSFGAVIAVARLGSSLSQTIAAGKRVLDLLDENPIVQAVKNGEKITEFAGAECEDVSFSYTDVGESFNQIEKSQNGDSVGISNLCGNQILSGISLSFPKNRIIGIQGKSGSGKSTLLKLLMRFWDADSGKIKISGTAIQKINTADLRKTESYVTQETMLFHDTIENNIKIARLNSTHDEIVAACKKASVHDFIESLPNGYETEIFELGENFSGGERQRLGLARSFLHESEFLLLDEPTSNLDSYNEKIILESVKAESKQKTVVLVSHRSSTLEICDEIHKIENGRKC
ncbi:MAG: ABC transporter ATP-binding protein/permease [Treponema sp.]|nr:ABC transporter ATP-binding protein/permease [Treponema sp.]